MKKTTNRIRHQRDGAGFRIGSRWASVVTGAVVALSMVSAELMLFGPVSDARTVQMATGMGATVPPTRNAEKTNSMKSEFGSIWREISAVTGRSHGSDAVATD